MAAGSAGNQLVVMESGVVVDLVDGVDDLVDAHVA
jgi:hypothetical protein